MPYDKGLTYPLELQQEIGRGGLGVVYLAYHHRLKKHVVVKRVKSGSMRAGDLRIEVDLLKNLHHSYLPQVYDFIQTKNGAYTVMEYVEGVGLSRYLLEGLRPTQEQLQAWLLQLCEVLSYLHAQTPPIIHSDIKPENILITTQGKVCLIDFNITPTATSSQIVGLSAGYASPEQRFLAQELCGLRDPYLGTLRFNVAGLAPSSDIYSLGATFADLILARPPGAPWLPRPRLSEMDLPYQQSFLQVIDRCTELDPARRYQSADELAEALRQRVRSDATYRRNRQRQWLVAALSALVMIAGVASLAAGLVALRDEAFEQAYAQFSQKVAAGDAQAIVLSGQSMLNNADFAAVLAENPADKANILRAMGDARMMLPQADKALEYYYEAMMLMRGAPGRDRYYRDYAIALAALGYHDEAETVIFEARAADVSSQQLELVQAQIHLQEDEPAKALAVAVPLCNGAEPEANARAALICADAYAALGDWPRRLDALQAAHSANPSPQTLRRLADAWLEQAALVASASEKASFYAKACEYLKPLCEQPYPGVLDRLNYSTALRASGELAASERLLLQLASEVAGDYRVPMQLAFLYEQKDELGKARSYCNQALAQIDSAPAAGAGSAGTGAGGAASGRGAAASDATNRELLLALQRRLSQ